MNWKNLLIISIDRNENNGDLFAIDKRGNKHLLISK